LPATSRIWTKTTLGRWRLRCLEAGEDPEQVEEDLGDALEEEMGDGDGGGFGGAPPTRDDGIYPM